MKKLIFIFVLGFMFLSFAPPCPKAGRLIRYETEEVTQGSCIFTKHYKIVTDGNCGSLKIFVSQTAVCL